MRDGFVVNDGEGEDEDEYSRQSGLLARVRVSLKPRSRSRGRTQIQMTIRPLDELPKKIRAKRASGKRKAEVVSSPSPKRSHQYEGEGSDDDIAAQPSRKRRKGADHSMSDLRIFSSATMAGPRLVHDRPAHNDFHSGAEPVASTSHLDEQESPYQLSHPGSSQESPYQHSHSGSSQKSAASSSLADESQTEDEFSQIDTEELSDDGYDIPPPSILGSYYRPFPRVITGSYYQEMS
ncbi:hypothetical protein DFJ58DRAFT_911141 [Suillus subalutaceus]|uniref:uncharacterized protein n=1 Tax=Suillus subalutaceus TaxID=48586 RepID=UPI001B872BB6|nr:uncharacterized protein DFJ58DRAFT_911141 [Suillus subalutaceus]KAG1870155.1 hypothetical protein DFJ58DRAFT_911141 [Suillus subalutaceus]